MEHKVTDEHINEYVSGELAGDELIEFEKLLSKDDSLKQQIKVHQQIDTVLADNYFEINSFNQDNYKREETRLKPILEKLNNQYFDEETLVNEKIPSQKTSIEKNRKSPILRKLVPLTTLAAAAAILLFLINPFAKGLEPNEIADKYFENYTTDTFRGDEMVADNSETLLAKGSEYYQNQNLKEAISTFKQLAESSSTVYANEAKWYLALCYLKQDKPEMAKPLLMALQRNAYYKKKTREILELLE